LLASCLLRATLPLLPVPSRPRQNKEGGGEEDEEEEEKPTRLVYVDLACPNDSGQKLRRGGLLFFFTSLFSFSLHDLIQARALF